MRILPMDGQLMGYYVQKTSAEMQMFEETHYYVIHCVQPLQEFGRVWMLTAKRIYFDGSCSGNKYD